METWLGLLLLITLRKMERIPPSDLDKNKNVWGSDCIKTIFDIDIMGFNFMLLSKKIMDGNTHKKFVSGSLLETQVDLFSENIYGEMERKLPSNLGINKNVFVFDAIKSLFGIYMATFNLKLSRKKMYGYKHIQQFC